MKDRRIKLASRALGTARVDLATCGPVLARWLDGVVGAFSDNLTSEFALKGSENSGWELPPRPSRRHSGSWTTMTKLESKDLEAERLLSQRTISTRVATSVRIWNARMRVRRHLGGIVGLCTSAGQRDCNAAVPAKQWPPSSAMSVSVVGDGVPDAMVGGRAS